RLNAQVVKLYAEGKYAEALPLAIRVLEIRDQGLESEHPLVTVALINLASVNAGLDKLDEAEKLYRRALNAIEKTGGGEGEQSANINYQLALIRYKKRDYKQTDSLLQRVLAIREKLLGPEHPGLVHTLLNIGALYLSRDGLDKAKSFYVRAMNILQKAPPRTDAVSIKALKNFLCALASTKDTETSKQVFSVLHRLENPEEVADEEKRKKEQEESGGDKQLVEGGVLNGRAISKPQPSYPTEAIQARISGPVLVQILVDEQGKVIKAEAICGYPSLARASEDAARRARFTPTLLSGQPVKVSGIITYNFILR
ncbi:MAG: TonB family protein, partial [Acidobacteria bacterium]|nr:TonB family protein [Acidobacteriota bacterium]